MTAKEKFIGKYLDKHMKNHGLPMGLEYYSLLFKTEQKAIKKWKKKKQKK